MYRKTLYLITLLLFGTTTGTELLPLEDLMLIEITTASRESELAWQTPAAVYTVSAEQIENMGATNIPDILRTVPGMYVAQISQNIWSVSCRGWAGQTSRQLLVMLNNRPIYVPGLDGVNWQHFNNLIPDIDRIEVVRGPGTLMWGSNAVNGVINIITKQPQTESSTTISAGVGDRIPYRGSITINEPLSETLNARLTLAGFHHDRYPSPTRLTHDDSRGESILLNLDWLPDPDHQIFIDTGYSKNIHGKEITRIGGEKFVDDLHNYNAHILGRWEYSLNATDQITAQIYQDYFRTRDQVNQRSVYSTDFYLQHKFSLGERHQIMYGIGGTFIKTDDTPTEQRPTENTHNKKWYWNLFIKDRYTMIEDKLYLTAGVKADYSPYNETVLLPALKLSYLPSADTTLWTSISSSAQHPTRGTVESRIILPVPLVTSGNIIYRGNDHTAHEEMIAYEAGVRHRFNDQFSIDATIFLFDYDELREGRQTFDFPDLIIEPVNASEAEIYGFELAAYWQPADWYSLNANYSFMRFERRLTTNDPSVTLDGGYLRSPRNMANLMHHFKITETLGMNLTFRYVDTVADADSMDLDAYIQTDLSFNWRPTDQLQIGLHGRNLFDKSNQEAGTSFYIQDNMTEVPRSVFCEVTYTF